MKRLILYALLLSGLMTSAQTSITSGSCKAQFKYQVNDMLMSPVAATAINFHDRSEGKVTAWFWDFGDGTKSEEQNPMHLFIHPAAGPNVKINPYRTVSLTILTSDTCKSLYSETINIMDGTFYEAPACKAGFKYYQTSYDSIGGTASFQTTNLSEGDLLTYFWQFDNEKTSTEKEPSVTFDLTKTERKVCLTVTGPNGCTDTFCDAVYVTRPDDPVISPAECRTYFKYSVNYTIQTLVPALILDFYPDASDEAVEWKWDFGDGLTSAEVNPTHIFNFPILADGSKAYPNPFRKVCLTVKTASGCEASYCETINIYMETVRPEEQKPTQCLARFKYYKPTDIVSIPELIPYQFNDASEGKVINRLWTFENGKTSTEADPQVSFDAFKATQKVCLTIFTDSCSDTYCETVYVSSIKPSTGYSMHYTASFPPQMSSCAGYVKAQVYLNDSVIKADNYAWSSGQVGQEVKGLCPTQTYTVKATTPDGNIVSGTFVFNSNGTVTEIPVNWWVTGVRDNVLIQAKPVNTDYIVEWHFCDGTVVEGDSIPLNSINCGAQDANLILKDASGNVVYSENISLKTMVTGLDPVQSVPLVKIYPNPVKDVLNIQYSGNVLHEMQVEILDITGKSISVQNLYQVDSGQTISLNVSTLKKGIYLCKMISDKKLLGASKFIK